MGVPALVRPLLWGTTGAALALMASGCGVAVTSSTPAPPVTTPTAMPTEEPSPQRAGTASLQRFINPELGFSIDYPDDWSLEATPAQEGEVVSLTSPDGTVSIAVVRDLPPPTIDLAGYGRVTVEILRLSLPEMEVVSEDATALVDGTPAHRARFTVSGEAPQAGDLLVTMRPRGEYTEAFIVQAVGPEEMYAAWRDSVLQVFESFRLEAVP